MIEQAEIPMLLKAVNVIKQMSEDEELKEIERMRDKALHDEASELGSARRKGISEGITIGRSEGITIGVNKERTQFIETMRILGISEDIIEQAIKMRENE